MSSSFAPLPNGAWPVLLTPFTQARSIDWAGLDQLLDYYLAAGVAGLFSVCLSSEMYQLSEDERVQLASHIVKRVAGRIPVIGSAVAGADTDAQIHAVKTMAATGLNAVVLLPCLMAGEHESDAAWQARMERIVAATPGIALGFYECPRPYKRAVPVESIRWAAHTGRFVFHKDTSHHLDSIAAKIAASRGTQLKVYTTQMSTLIPTLEAGGHGFSSYGANLFPELVQWVCENFSKDPAKALELQRLIAIAEYCINGKYPASAKVFVRENAGVPIGSLCRGTYDTLSLHDTLPLIDLSRYVKSLSLPVTIVSLAADA